MTRDEQVERIERERREREAALLLLMLALAERTRLNVVRAIRVGADWPTALRNTFLGNASLDLPGGMAFLPRMMAEAAIAGFVSTGTSVGVALAPPAVDELIPAYRPIATRALERTAEYLRSNVAQGLADVADKDRISADSDSVGESFAKVGWTPEKPFGAKVNAEAAITRTYAIGMQAGVRAPEVAAITTGLIFTAVLDNATTAICRARNGVVLPSDDPYWARSWPPLHMNCRSLVIPTIRKVTFTENPPESPPPTPGWGQYSGFLSGPAWP